MFHKWHNNTPLLPDKLVGVEAVDFAKDAMCVCACEAPPGAGEVAAEEAGSAAAVAAVGAAVGAAAGAGTGAAVGAAAGAAAGSTAWTSNKKWERP